MRRPAWMAWGASGATPQLSLATSSLCCIRERIGSGSLQKLWQEEVFIRLVSPFLNKGATPACARASRRSPAEPRDSPSEWVSLQGNDLSLECIGPRLPLLLSGKGFQELCWEIDDIGLAQIYLSTRQCTDTTLISICCLSYIAGAWSICLNI